MEAAFDVIAHQLETLTCWLLTRSLSRSDESSVVVESEIRLTTNCSARLC